MCLKFQQTQTKEKTIHHDIPLSPWEVLGVDIFQLNNKNYLCVVDYHSKFLVIKRMEGLSAESLIATVKIIFDEYCILHRLMSDASSNFISERFKNFCNSLNIDQAVSSWCHHQSNGQVEASMKFIKCTIKSAQTLVVIYVWSCYKLEPHHWDKVSQAQQHCWFNHPVHSIMPAMDRKPINIDNDHGHHKNLMHRQGKNDQNNDT